MLLSNFTPSKCVEICLLSLVEKVSDKLCMFMPHVVIPPLTHEIRNIFFNQIVQYQQLLSSYSVFPYTHISKALPMPASCVFCQQSPPSLISDCKHCGRVKFEDSFSEKYSSCDPYNSIIHLALIHTP